MGIYNVTHVRYDRVTMISSIIYQKNPNRRVRNLLPVQAMNSIASPLLCRRCIARLNSPIPYRSTSIPSLLSRHLARSQKSFHSRAPSASPIVPPNPAELPKATPAKHYVRTRKWLRRLVWASLFAGGVLALDHQFYASSLQRSLRTFGLGLLIGFDYKINFRPHPPLADSIEALHARTAERVFNLLRTNGGLYLKIGQAIAMQSAVLPPQFQEMFAKMFDDAPQNSWGDVERVIREDFGKGPEEVFGVSFSGEPGYGLMERTARASASVAQVHWARLQDGREVAIKIQKREIAQQVGWDLWAFRVVARVYTWWFDIPMYNLVDFVSERLMLETDFENEADNGQLMKGLIAGEPRLCKRVYVPEVFRNLSSRRVMTAEWIEGVRLWDKKSITSSWQGGWRTGTPGCGNTPLDPPGPSVMAQIPHDDPNNERLKPERDHWRGRSKTGGLGLSMKQVMGTMVDLFSAQMFLWGWVHCDPHPGNIFVRRKPSGDADLVLIDHGLYIHMSPQFRHEYSMLWKSLMTFDNKTIANIVRRWGINNPDLFASATLMRPYTGGDQSTSSAIRDGLKGKDEAERAFEMQQKMRQGVREILSDEKQFPRELLFIGRNLRIVQGNNQFLGSPVNRIKITGNWASASLIESSDLPFTERLRNLWTHLIFKFVLFGSDVVFYISKVRQLLGVGRGMEDDMEEQMRYMAKDFGFELRHGVFDG